MGFHLECIVYDPGYHSESPCITVCCIYNFTFIKTVLIVAGTLMYPVKFVQIILTFPIEWFFALIEVLVSVY
jgi:hypothetical protein